ncbi:MAG TPA: isoaspartyl peptidase/L-asparaginase [Planctomycetota bacterium]
MSDPLVLVHGGAGNVPEARRETHLEGCRRAAERGGEVLDAGGSAVEAASAAVVVLEDDNNFNAGTGCALDRNGRVSLDAAVMCGATLNAGAVAALPPFRNPVLLAVRLLERREVLIVGPAAAAWAAAEGFELLPDDAMITPGSRREWQRVIDRGEVSNWAGGTVGAVARDAQGRLAAATSTGGAMGKPPGRVGDSPLIGMGTYADGHAAISATGDGEAFIRTVFAARVADAIAAGAAPEAALKAGLERVHSQAGGNGGAILVGPTGGPVAARHAEFMSHAWWTPAGSGVGS